MEYKKIDDNTVERTVKQNIFKSSILAEIAHLEKDKERIDGEIAIRNEALEVFK